MSDPISDSGRAKKQDDAEKRVKEFLDNVDKGDDAANDDLVQSLDADRDGKGPRRRQ